MGRLLIALTLLASTLLLPGATAPAHASEWWCWDDPVLVIDGRVVHIYTGVPAGAVPQVAVAEVTVTVPNGVNAKLTATASPRFPQTATLVRAGSIGPDGAVTVTASAVIRGSGDFAAGLRMVQPSGDESAVFGRSNQPVSTSLTLTAKPNPNGNNNVNSNNGNQQGK